MKSPSTSEDKHGFTLIELLIVLAMLSVLAAYGVIVGIDSLTRYNFHAESDNAITALESARSKSINNIGGEAHGVWFDTAGGKLVVFRGATHATSVSELEIAMQPAFTYDAGACANTEVVFAQLSGDTVGCEIKINGPQVITITLNNEGGIDY